MPNDAAVIFSEHGRAGVATLNRPAALNALNRDMIQGLEAHHLKWARSPKIYGVLLKAEGDAFCAGGDLRVLHGRIAAGEMTEALDYFRGEYQHCWTLQTFTKPNVALIDGLMMGGGAGICLYGTHRVAGDGFAFAMPETGIGFFPDIGASYFLPRMPGNVGVYLGLSGHTIRAADAHWTGVVTHCIPSADFELIANAVASGDPIDPFLDALHRAPGESELARRQPAIDHCFGAASVEEILSRLDAVSGPDQDWARETAAILRRRSPLSLKVTLRFLQQPQPSLKAALATEYRLASRFLRAPDFLEGVRATLIDKDGAPKWMPATLREATAEMVSGFFDSLGAEEIEFKDHWVLIA